MHDISSSILKTRAEKGKLATYWSQPEQEERLKATYTRYEAVGDIWSAAAPQVRPSISYLMQLNGKLNLIGRCMRHSSAMSRKGVCHAHATTLRLMEAVSRGHTRRGMR